MRLAVGLGCAAVLLFGTDIKAQSVTNNFVSNTTPQGDYLRGVGAAAYGLGEYNVLTAQGNVLDAQATAIDVDTTIRWNEYWWKFLKNENRENAEAHAQRVARQQENFRKIRERVRNSPLERDVLVGDALNDLMDQLATPRKHESYYQSRPPLVSVDMVRRIPFRLAEQGVQFSMYRLSPKGKDKWPIALNDPRLARERRACERAFDRALDRQIDGLLVPADVKAVAQTVEELARRFEAGAPPSGTPLYYEAANRLKDLQSSAALLGSHKVEIIVGDLERYAGTTVDDLHKFMRSHNLRFAAAETKEERALYPELYTLLKQQQEFLELKPQRTTK